MALKATHAFVSAKSDGPDTTVVRPSNWNADHVVVGFSPDALDDFDSVVDAVASTLTETTSPLTLTTAANSNAAADRLFPVKAIGDGNPQLQVNSEGWGKYGLMRSGDTVDMRLTSSSTPEEEYVATLLIDGVADADCPTFSVTTAAVTDYASDSFTGSNGTTLSGRALDVGGTWTVVSGTWEIQSGRAKCVAHSGANNLIYTDVGYADTVITCDLWNNTSPYWRLMANYVDASNYWLCLSQTGATEIYEVTGGGFTLRASGSTSSLATNTTYPCTLETAGNTIKWTIDGVLVSYTSGGSRAHKTSTKHGLIGYYSGNGQYDNWVASPP